VTAPDQSVTSDYYTVIGGMHYTAHYDARMHATNTIHDALGRPIQVLEYRGNGGTEGGPVLETTTTYTYDALDRLVTAVDPLNNTTTLSYDTLGRKVTMVDPDMGTWNYYYDANSNLVTQSDARGVNTNFYYDALNRLITKSFSNGQQTDTYYYDQAGVANSIGRRTAACVINSSGVCVFYQAWIYDGRGRTTSATQSVGGVVLGLTTGYDSADRAISQT
jgi:YD repeat-containing protein